MVVIRLKKFNCFETFSKAWVTILMVIAVVDMQFSYILAFLGKTSIAESLSIAIATEIIGVMCGYFFKSFLETHSEKKNELIREFNGNPFIAGSDAADLNTDTTGTNEDTAVEENIIEEESENSTETD
jgi:DeoR/GlpR family transcriptional regulator of sugar metabolism